MSPNLPITLNNTFYQQWGLVSAVVVILAALIPFLYWFWNLDTDRTLAARLRIVAVLAGMFEKTVFEEADKIISIIDYYLPTALSQADDPAAEPSAFDNFCKKIRDLEEGEFDREVVRLSLTESLAGILVKEVRRQIDSERASSITGRRARFALYSGFEFETQQKLLFLAEISVQAKKKEKRFQFGRRWVKNLWICAVCLLVLFIPCVFFNSQWVYYVGTATLLLFAGAMLIGLYALFVFFNGKNWLEEQADHYPTPEAWFAELSRTN